MNGGDQIRKTGEEKEKKREELKGKTR